MTIRHKKSPFIKTWFPGMIRAGFGRPRVVSIPPPEPTTLVSEPAATSPHWPHINVLDFARGAKYQSADTILRAATFTWLIQHIDYAEGSLSFYQATGLNPTFGTFSAVLDWTDLKDRPEAYNLGLAANEASYLHVADDTQISFYERVTGVLLRTVNLTGEPTGTPTLASRLVHHIWTDERWIFNPLDATFRAAMVAYMATDVAAGYRGWFIDEHNPLLPCNGAEFSPGYPLDSPPASVPPGNINSRAIITRGGHIREYADRVGFGNSLINSATVGTEYRADVNSMGAYWKAQFPTALMLQNLGESWYAPTVLPTVIAYGGADTEFSVEPHKWPLDYFTQLIAPSFQATDAGARLDLMGSWGADRPPGPNQFPPGIYSTTTAPGYDPGYARYQFVRLVQYYMLKESVGAPGKMYFNPSFYVDFASPAVYHDFMAGWILANQVNVGLPADLPSLFPGTGWSTGGTILIPLAGCPVLGGTNPVTVYQRHYTGGPHGDVLMLLRNMDYSDCDIYDDTTNVTLTLPSPMRRLLDNGTLLPASSTVVLRNVDAAILFPG